jgi:hypothetical protein
MKSLHDMSTTSIASKWPATAGDPVQERLGCELKTMFDNLTAGPLPDRLVQLADALEEAFRRGELSGPRSRTDA